MQKTFKDIEKNKALDFLPFNVLLAERKKLDKEYIENTQVT